MDTIVATIPSLPEPAQVEANKQSEAEIVRQGQSHNLADIQPVENKDQAVLNGLGIGEDFKMLPESEQANVTEIAQYVQDLLDAKGIPPTQQAFDNKLNLLKEQMGLDPDTMSQVVLDKLGGIVRAWKSLAFMTDDKERRNLFYKLARLGTAKEMNDAVFEQMNKQKVWQ